MAFEHLYLGLACRLVGFVQALNTYSLSICFVGIHCLNAGVSIAAFEANLEPKQTFDVIEDSLLLNASSFYIS